MNFLKGLLGRNSKPAPGPIKPLVSKKQEQHAKAAAETKNAKLRVVDTTDAVSGDATDQILENAAAGAKQADPAPVNIWDLDGEDAAAAPAEDTSGKRRRRRTQTRVLGFTAPDEDALSTFDKAAKVAPTARAKFPVGWILVVDGPGRGECFALEAGMSQIGRADDQAINLDFGDNSISRVNHAAIVYDSDSHSFILGHGGKKNIVRLNGKPVVSNEEISNGDQIYIGETTLRFVALCTEDFNWDTKTSQAEETDHVAIA